MVEQAAAAAETAPAPAKSISEMLQQFYQHHADRKWDEEYQELLKKAVSYLLARVMDYTRIVYAHIPAPHVYQLEPANIPDYLGKVLLPELQQTLLRLSRAMDPSQLAENDLEERKAWYDSNMHHFVHIDDQLEELDDVRSTLWRKLPLGKGLLRHDDNNHHSYVQLTNFRARQTQYKVRTLLAEPIARVLAACDSFFHAVSFSNPATDKRLLSSRWGVIARRINSSNDHMDCFIKWLQQPLVNIAKEEWQKMVEKIETLLRSLLKHLNPLYHKFEKGYESSSDDELVPLNPTAMKFVRMGLTVLKICRIYFNKLSRATNSQPLIFAQSCMEMDMKYLKRLLTCTQDAQTFISVFATELRALPSHRRQVIEFTANLIGRFVESSHVLEDYWDALIAKNHPNVDTDAIEDNRRWLKSWSDNLYLATAKIMSSTG
ncbi:hypothetical protein VP01_2102g6 [Puccinia sorghi]|uniref:Uncharacterized protein n=1 Tax=Puccinia sorghi TaxID=27349 RepID=A0A0L6VA55_9BASI|nr:hypothetical protein VP01_2102g6 [Puccinia sorghi]